MRTMKKCFALLLALVMALSLCAIPAAASGEAGEVVLVDNDDFTMTLTGYDPEGSWGPTFEALVENKMDKDAYFGLRNIVVNGVMCSPAWSENVPAGKKTYTEISWFAEDLEGVGINYIESVRGQLNVYDSETYDDIYWGDVSWNVDTSDQTGPSVEQVVSESGFVAQDLLSTDEFLIRAIDYDPQGGYNEDQPSITLYVENHTDKIAWFNLDDVSVDGFMCDPYWGMDVAPNAAAYSRCYWSQDALASSHIDEIGVVEFTAEVTDDDTWEDLASVKGTLDLTGGGAAAPAEASGSETPVISAGGAAGGTAAATGTGSMLGHVEDNVYTNEYFGVACTVPAEWEAEDEAELLKDMGSDETSFSALTEEGVQELLEKNSSGAIVASATSDDGLEMVQIQLIGTEGLGQYLTEEELVDVVLDMMDLGMDGATIEKNTYTLAGEDHAGIYIVVTDSSLGIDVTMYVEIVLLLKDDCVMMALMGTTFEDTIAEVAQMFTPLA